MGWLWSSSPDSAPSSADRTNDDQVAEQPKSDFGLTEAQRTRIFGRPRTEQSAMGSREEQADAELDAFVKSFSAPDASKSTPNASMPQDQATHAVEHKPTNHDRILPDGSLNISPMALYPATMNCRHAFDQAFYCQSLGGKFNDVYRFGHVKDCSEQWGAFWFCMRTRTLPSRDKEAQIREYYRDRDERRRKENGGNSEDIWELRTKPVERAFWRDPDAVEDGHEAQVKE